jgi:hypothetical protein
MPFNHGRFEFLALIQRFVNVNLPHFQWDLNIFFKNLFTLEEGFESSLLPPYVNILP